MPSTESPSRAVRPSRRVELVVFVLSMAIALVPALLVVFQHDGNSSVLLRIGDRSASRSFVEADFPDPVLVKGWGHDGQQFYVVARTFPNLQDADGHVDRLRYRARRVLFPAVVSPFPAGAPTAWAMLAVNVLAVGAAAVGVGRLAWRLGAPSWVGISAALSPALLISPRASLGDALAFALAIWGVVLWRRSIWPAAVLFALAALTRETTLVAPAVCLLLGNRRQRLVLLTPFAVYGAWVLATAAWLKPTIGAQDANPVADALRQFAPPFRAWVNIGFDQTTILLAALLFVGSLFAAWHLRDRLPEIALWLVADAILLAISAEAVAEEALNFVRLAPLAVPGVALAVASARWHRDPTPVDEPVAAAP